MLMTCKVVIVRQWCIGQAKIEKFESDEKFSKAVEKCQSGNEEAFISTRHAFYRMMELVLESEFPF